MKRDGNKAGSNDLGRPVRVCSPTSFMLPLFLLVVGPLANIGAGQTSPSDDSYITSSKTAGNYGTGTSQAVQAPGTSSLIRFDLSGVSDNVGHVKLFWAYYSVHSGERAISF